MAKKNTRLGFFSACLIFGIGRSDVTASQAELGKLGEGNGDDQS